MVTASFSPVSHRICDECARDFDRVKKTVAFIVVAAHNVLFRICVFFFRISSSAVNLEKATQYGSLPRTIYYVARTKPRRSRALFYSPAAAAPAPLADRIARLCGDEGARVKKARPTCERQLELGHICMHARFPFPIIQPSMHATLTFCAEDELHMGGCSVQTGNNNRTRTVTGTDMMCVRSEQLSTEGLGTGEF